MDGFEDRVSSIQDWQEEMIRHEERNRIARELHNELGRALTAMKFELAGIAKSVPSTHKRLSRRVASLEHTVSASMQAVQQICRGLYRIKSPNMALRTAVDREIARLQRNTGIECELTWKLKGDVISERISCLLFEVLAESLTNAARHSGARHVQVRFFREGDVLIMEVKDDGRGCPNVAQASARSLGFINMREAAHRAGGIFEVTSGLDAGTLVRVRLPVYLE